MTTPINNRLFVTDFLVPAGGIATFPPVLDDVRLLSLRVIIPDGHNGLTGFQITSGGTVVFPYGPDPFIRGNDEIFDFPWDAEITQGGLLLVGQNSDIFDHTFFLRWTLGDLGGAASPVQITSPQAAPPLDTSVASIMALAGVTDATVLLSPDDLAALAAAPDLATVTP